MERIASFTVDHNVLVPGLYLSRRDGNVVTFDLPGKSAAECGNYRNLDVALARDCCRYYAEVIADWNVEKLVYPTGK